jgi:hypothetical protein
LSDRNLGLTIDSEKRFQIFIERIIKTKMVWGLRSEEGWCVSPSNEYEETEVMPFWSDRAYAQQCAVEEWEAFKPVSISLEEFMEAWLPGLETDQLLVGTNWNVRLIGKEIEPFELRTHLNKHII